MGFTEERTKQRSTRILAIDPGPEESAWVLFDGDRPIKFAKELNEDVLALCAVHHSQLWEGYASRCVIEKIASFGMPVGAEVFETVYWTGRFVQMFGPGSCDRITRIAVKSHLCHSAKAKDGNVRQALIDRFGPVGTKKAPGKLFGVSGDVWSALAVATTWWDSQFGEKAA